MADVNLNRVQDITIYRGDTWPCKLTFTDDDGDAIDITDWTVYFTIKRNESDADSDAVIAKTITAHSNPTYGLTAFTLEPTETKALLGVYYYDIQVLTNDDEVYTILKGQFISSTDITRAG